MKKPFQELQRVYGKKMTEMKAKKRTSLDSLAEIFTYNKARNATEHRNTTIFNVMLVTSLGFFLLFLVLYMSGTLAFMN